jgi:hypothetical protein
MSLETAKTRLPWSSLRSFIKVGGITRALSMSGMLDAAWSSCYPCSFFFYKLSFCTSFVSSIEVSGFFSETSFGGGGPSLSFVSRTYSFLAESYSGAKLRMVPFICPSSFSNLTYFSMLYRREWSRASILIVNSFFRSFKSVSMTWRISVLAAAFCFVSLISRLDIFWFKAEKEESNFLFKKSTEESRDSLSCLRSEAEVFCSIEALSLPSSCSILALKVAVMSWWMLFDIWSILISVVLTRVERWSN